jgi:membrane protein implicated in regulation of membrane protease activity
VIGLILAMVVVAIVSSLLGQWKVGIAIGVVSVILFVVFVRRLGRRTAAGKS